MIKNFGKTKHPEFPESVVYILSELERRGFSAYAVGGCIRDSLLGRVPDDWDVASSALPEQVMEVFGENALPTGLKHGTVTVRHGGFCVEVTTFRADGEYSDHRRPDSVSFVRDIESDLARRDFTMNAIAAPLSGGLVDPFGGQDDIARGLIRCVGAPEKRFSEDALRMLRAVRFSSKLGFKIEEKTLSAIYECSSLARSLAPERVAAELEKLLLGSSASAMSLLFSSGLMRAFAASGEIPDFSPVFALECKRLPRLSGLCAVLQRAEMIEASAFLKQLRLDTETIKTVSAGVCAALSGLPDSDAKWKLLQHKIGQNACRCACFAHAALGNTSRISDFEAIISGGDCLSLGELAVNGKDLMSLGYSGRELGIKLETLLEHVFKHPESNSREALLALLEAGDSNLD